MKVLLIDNCEPDDLSGFNSLLFDSLAALADTTLLNYTAFTGKSEPNAYDSIVLSGVPLNYSFDTIAHRAQALQWVTHTTLPVLGICLGHQSIGSMFGSKIIEHKDPEIGMIPATIEQPDDPIFKDLRGGLLSPMYHRGSVTVPPDFTLLARTAACPNAIMRHKTKNIYGFQFHPEGFPEGEHPTDGLKLLSSFVAIALAQQNPDPESSLIDVL